MIRGYKIKFYSAFKNQIPKMTFVQLDTKANRITFELYDDLNVPMTNIKEATATVERVDGKTYTYGMSDFEISENFVTFVLPPSAVYLAGKCEATISVYDDNYGRLTIPIFSYTVTPELVSDTPIDETNEYPVLTDLINETNVLKEAYQGAIDGSIAAQDHVEIVNARKGKTTLKEKIDEIDTSLSGINTDIGNIGTDIDLIDAQVLLKENKITTAKETYTSIIGEVIKEYSYADMISQINQLQAKYGDKLTVETIGQTMLGRDIKAIILGNRNGKYKTFVMSGQHARESHNTPIILKQIEYYCENWDKLFQGENISDIFKNSAIFYVPAANPDGMELSRITTAADWDTAVPIAYADRTNLIQKIKDAVTWKFKNDIGLNTDITTANDLYSQVDWRQLKVTNLGVSYHVLKKLSDDSEIPFKSAPNLYDNAGTTIYQTSSNTVRRVASVVNGATVYTYYAGDTYSTRTSTPTNLGTDKAALPSQYLYYVDDGATTGRIYNYTFRDKDMYVWKSNANGVDLHYNCWDDKNSSAIKSWAKNQGWRVVFASEGNMGGISTNEDGTPQVDGNGVWVGAGGFTEAETIAIRDFIKNNGISKYAISYHGRGPTMFFNYKQTGELVQRNEMIARDLAAFSKTPYSQSSNSLVGFVGWYYANYPSSFSCTYETGWTYYPINEDNNYWDTSKPVHICPLPNEQFPYIWKAQKETMLMLLKKYAREQDVIVRKTAVTIYDFSFAKSNSDNNGYFTNFITGVTEQWGSSVVDFTGLNATKATLEVTLPTPFISKNLGGYVNGNGTINAGEAISFNVNKSALDKITITVTCNVALNRQIPINWYVRGY